jgi:hypothetical protein
MLVLSLVGGIVEDSFLQSALLEDADAGSIMIEQVGNVRPTFARILEQEFSEIMLKKKTKLQRFILGFLNFCSSSSV